MICKRCKRSIVDDAVFCSYCGIRLGVKQAVSNTKNAVSSLDSNRMKLLYTTILEVFQEVVPNGINTDKYFNPKKKTNIDDIFYCFCMGLQDYNMMPSVIGFLKPERRDTFAKIFIDYNLHDFNNLYDEESLYKCFCNEFTVKNPDNPRNLWRKYTKAVIDAANYLSRFNDAEEYNSYVGSFGGTLDIMFEITKEIHGAGFAIACNIIKDLGFTQYAKPDTHTKEVVEAMGFYNDDVSAIKAIQVVAETNGDTAYNLDRYIWLICSGYYFLDDYRVGPNKKALINKLKDL